MKFPKIFSLFKCRKLKILLHCVLLGGLVICKPKMTSLIDSWFRSDLFVLTCRTITRVILNITNSRIRSSYHNISIFIIQVHGNTVKWLLTSPYNIDKIFCKNPSEKFLFQNFRNFKADFFLNLYLRIFFVKQVSFRSYSFYGVSLWHLQWISGQYSV